MLAAGMGRGDGGEENILGMRMVGEGGDIAQSWAKTDITQNQQIQILCQEESYFQLWRVES